MKRTPTYWLDRKTPPVCNSSDTRVVDDPVADVDRAKITRAAVQKAVEAVRRMRGKVITRSENLLARAARKAGLPITAGPSALVEFENGFRMVVDSRARVEKIR